MDEEKSEFFFCAAKMLYQSYSLCHYSELSGDIRDYGMFQYGLRQLRIEGNIRSLTSGLGGLEQIEAGAVG